ncbi:MAG TPA: energy-coupling factor transporter transmembrane component T, partial [Bacillota bacterium]
MLQDLLIGQYYPVESPVHRLDPRTKILATMALVMALFFVRVLPGYGAVALLTIAVIVAARLPVSLIARSLRPVLWLVLLTVGLHALTSGREGELLWHLGPLRVTDDGLALGLVMGVRLALLVVISSLLTLTTSPIELTDG